MRKFPHVVIVKILCSLIVILSGIAGYCEDYRWIAVGSLHNWFSDAGCEIEVGRRHLVADQQDGLIWPAQYLYQDIQVAKGLWIGAIDYTDPLANGTVFPYKVIAVGPRYIKEDEFMPVKFELRGKFPHPKILINGANASQEYLKDQIDVIDQSLPTDRLLINVVNTSMGITITRKIYADSHPGDDNYMIYEYIFKNTGIYTKAGAVNQQTLKDMVIMLQFRYAPTRYAAWFGYYYAPQSVAWGHSTVNDILHPFYNNPTKNPYNLRGFYSWLGQHSKYGVDNIGGPNIGSSKIAADGFLGAAQFPGVVVLHADKSASDKSDDTDQPKSAPFFSSDADFTQFSYADQFNASHMETEYKVMTKGLPAQTHAELVGNQYADLWQPSATETNPGGYTQALSFGPYTLAPGDSIRLVLAEGVNGLSRSECKRIGGQWYTQNGPYIKPDGSQTSNRDEFKNTWVFTGHDSLRKTFEQAIRNWDNGLLKNQIPPPQAFEVNSDSDCIHILWASNAENDPHFGGYRLYRAIGSYENPYDLIFQCGVGGNSTFVVNYFKDTLVSPGEDYYYYLTTFSDGILNPPQTGSNVESSLFWTRTTEPARLISNPLIYTDVYVSTNGSDSSIGTDPSQPFRTITHALSRISSSIIHPYTIHILGGVYSPAQNNETFPLVISKHVNISGDADNPAILDAQGNGTVIKINSPFQVSLTNLIIQNGLSNSGGGIYVGNKGNLVLQNVSLKSNQAVKGGGIYLEQGADIIFNSERRCNFLDNQAAIGADIYGEPHTRTEVFLDTAMVAKPCDYLIAPSEMYLCDVLHPLRSQYQADLFVSPVGSDENTGLAAATPLRTIRQAIICLDPQPGATNRIHLASGVYTASTTGESFPILGKNALRISGDSIAATIIDAEHSESVFFTDHDTDLVLENLTIINGQSEQGGGLLVVDSRPTFINLNVHSNQARKGGALACIQNSKAYLSRVRIVGNLADYGGALFLAQESRVVFDEINRCNIYSNDAAVKGKEFWSEYLPEPIAVILDTFTLQYPTAEYAFPLDNFSFDIKSGIVLQVEADLYVNAAAGKDENSGMNSEHPLKTIRRALEIIFADQKRPHEIILMPGTYGAANAEEFPINCKSYVSITGVDGGETIIDAGQTAPVFLCKKVDKAVLSNLKITNGKGQNGGGIILDSSEVSINNVIISNNSANNGAGIYANTSQLYITSSQISSNSATNEASGIFLSNSTANINRLLLCDNTSKYDVIYSLLDLANPGTSIFSHLTIADNTVSSNFGAIRTKSDNNRLIILNSIIRSAAKYKVYKYGDLIIANSSVQDSLSGIGGPGVLRFVQGLSARDPLFVGGMPPDYHLHSTSPCIDKGLRLFTYEGDTLLNIESSEYLGNAPDLGALESPYSVGVLSDFEPIPKEFFLFPNYPNPFNSLTYITYTVPVTSQVEISVYDLNGHLVRTLVNRREQPGYKSEVWLGDTDFGLPVSSGIYLCSMNAGRFHQSRKIILLK